MEKTRTTYKYFLLAHFFIAFMLSACFCFSQNQTGWKTETLDGNKIELPPFCNFIIHDTLNPNHGLFKVNNDTLSFVTWDNYYTAGTNLFKPIKMQRGQMTVCGNYRGPGFCEPSFNSLPDITYPLDSAAYKKSCDDVKAYNQREKDRLLQAKAQLEKNIAYNKYYVDFGMHLRNKMQTLVKSYEEKKDSVQLEAEINENNHLSISYKRTIYNADGSFRLVGISVFGYLTDKKSMDVLVEIMKTVVIKQK